MRPRASLWSVVRQLLPPFLICAAFAGAGIVQVGGRVLVVRTGYTLSELQQENQALTRENDRLRLELATLRGPSWLEQLARGQLGMAPAPATAVFTIVSAPRVGRAGPKEAPR